MMQQVPRLILAALCLISLAHAERPAEDAMAGLEPGTAEPRADGIHVRATGAFQAMSQKKSSPDLHYHGPAGPSLTEGKVGEASMLQVESEESSPTGATAEEAEANAQKYEPGWTIPAGERDPLGKGEPLTKMLKPASITVGEKKPTEIKEWEKNLDPRFKSFEDGKENQPLAVSDAYENLREFMVKKEQLVQNPEFDTEKMRASGQVAFEKNNAYHTELRKYIKSLFDMSGGAHALTKKEFDDHLKIAKATADKINSGNLDAPIQAELTGKKGHFSEEHRAMVNHDDMKVYGENMAGTEAVVGGKGQDNLQNRAQAHENSNLNNAQQSNAHQGQNS